MRVYLRAHTCACVLCECTHMSSQPGSPGAVFLHCCLSVAESAETSPVFWTESDLKRTCRTWGLCLVSGTRGPPSGSSELPWWPWFVGRWLCSSSVQNLPDPFSQRSPRCFLREPPCWKHGASGRWWGAWWVGLRTQGHAALRPRGCLWGSAGVGSHLVS